MTACGWEPDDTYGQVASAVSALALSLALGAAAVHAFWNVLLARARDAQAAAALAIPLSIVIYAPMAALRWQIDWRVIPYLAASSSLQLVYFMLLIAAYQRFELGVVYPLARGLAPVIVLVAGRVVAPALPTTLQIGAVLVISAGVILVRGFKRHGHLRDAGLAVAIAACIAGYTLVDKTGLRYADPVVYLELVMTPVAVVYGLTVVRLRGLGAVRAEFTLTTLFISIATFGAYTLVLTALRLAPAAAVAAVRETSVVLVTILAAIVLRERVSGIQVLGAVCVAAGVALLAFA
jgi:drug/metabolite transporter (DMT)-like permease